MWLSHIVEVSLLLGNYHGAVQKFEYADSGVDSENSEGSISYCRRCQPSTSDHDAVCTNGAYSC